MASRLIRCYRLVGTMEFGTVVVAETGECDVLGMRKKVIRETKDQQCKLYIVASSALKMIRSR